MARLFPEFQFMWIVEETKKNLPLELDFLHEGKNSEKLQERFSKLEFLKVAIVSFNDIFLSAHFYSDCKLKF